MGLHNLPAQYDAWKLASPEDMRPARRARFAHEFLLEIEPDADWAREVTCEASFSETGQMLNVLIDGKPMAPHELEARVGADEFNRICEAADPEIEQRLIEAERDALDDWADHQNDLRRDH